MFRQYTDRTYNQQIPGPAWLGFLGPVLRAEVGDVILVHLKNFASRNYSIHPHGVFYEKDAEGKKLQNGNSAKICERTLPHCLPGGGGCTLWKGRTLRGHCHVPLVKRSQGVLMAPSLTFPHDPFPDSKLWVSVVFHVFFAVLVGGRIVSTTHPALLTGF